MERNSITKMESQIALLGQTNSHNIHINFFFTLFIYLIFLRGEKTTTCEQVVRLGWERWGHASIRHLAPGGRPGRIFRAPAQSWGGFAPNKATPTYVSVR